MKQLLSAPLEFLYDFHGGKSSKRFWGNRLLTIGVFLALLLFSTVLLVLVASFFFMEVTKVFPPVAFQQCKDIILMFIGFGGGLLFGGVFENIRKKK